MTGYRFHPEAETDLNEIWKYIAAESIDAADRVSDEIEKALEILVPFRIQDTAARTSPAARCALSGCAIT